MTDLSCAKTVLNPYTKRSEETTRVLPFGYQSPNSIYSAVFVMSLQNSNERRDMYVQLHNSKVKDTVARREPETFGLLVAETQREILTNAGQSFTKRGRKRIR